MSRGFGAFLGKNHDPTSGKNAAGQSVPAGQSESRDSAPLGAATSGRLIFASGASNVAIRADPTTGVLYRARFEGNAPSVGVRGGTVTVRYPRFPSFDWLYSRREPPSEVILNASIPWRIEVRGGVSKLTADLRELHLGSLDLAGGASRVELALPKPSGTVEIRVLGGANNVIIRRPAGVGARVRVVGGSTKLTFDEERFGAVGGEVDLRSPEYDGAADRYDIAVTGGANNLTIDTR